MTNLGIKGDIVNRFMMRGKMVIIVRLDHDEDSFYMFKVTDKCNKKDYFSNEKYSTIEECERDSKKICKGV